MKKKNKRISRIPNDVQDRNSVAWKRLCDYIDQVAEEEIDEFVPREELGDKLFAQIFTLPESISKLKKVKKIGLYGSQLKRLPPEIGELESLEYFDPYTSYNLHWFPCEITKCKNLKDSRISTRALYGNYKNRMRFPDISHNPVRYEGDTVRCSICNEVVTYEQVNQVWITLKVGTDIVPLLVTSCSEECENRLPTPPENYIQHPHKGGSGLAQPPDEDELWELKMAEQNQENEDISSDTKPENVDNEVNLFNVKPIKLIKKIWEND